MNSLYISDNNFSYSPGIEDNWKGYLYSHAIYTFANAKYSDLMMKIAVATFREGSGANNTGKYNNYKYYHDREIESMILKYMKPWEK